MKKYLTNVRIYSFKRAYLTADTIEISRGKISKIGSKEDILPSRKNTAQISDLQGALLIPGFTDSHIHLLAYGKSLQHIDAHTSTKSECLKRVQERAEKTPKGKWIIGHGWDHNIWTDGYGYKIDLDKISNDHPIYLSHKSLHSGWANTKALELAGINKNSTNPPNGKILRDENGDANGILLEGATQLIENVIPKPNNEENIQTILAAQKELNRFGITGVHDFDPWIVYSVLNQLKNSGDLHIRVAKGIPASFLEDAINSGLKSGEGDDWLRIGWLKLFADGALGPQTAAMLAPYENSDSEGMLLLDRKAIMDYGERAMKNKIALAVHAIGDRANREVLYAYQDLNKMELLSKPWIPSRIEHVQIIDKADIGLFKKNDITASMQPIHAISDRDMADEFWGNRCSNAYAWKSIKKDGTRLIFGSDAPVESPNPIFGIYAAISRKKLDGGSNESWISDQCINIHDAISAYCDAPSRSLNLNHLSGSIEEGKLADFVVLPNKFIFFTPSQIRDTQPYATMVNGNWVYKNDKIDIEFN